MFKFMNYDSKFSTVVMMVLNLVLLNVVFLVTCLPIFTIGAAFNGLYSTTLKVVRKEEGYMVRGYFKAFKSGFKQSTALTLIAIVLFVILYVVDMAASLNGGSLSQIYFAITLALAILYCFYFLFAFALVANFENTLRNTIYNTFALIFGNFALAVAQYLCMLIPFILSFFVSANIMRYATLFWILIGFALIALWQSVYLNRIFAPLRGDDQDYAENPFGKPVETEPKPIDPTPEPKKPAGKSRTQKIDSKNKTGESSS